jgi:hypothetical protein
MIQCKKLDFYLLFCDSIQVDNSFVLFHKSKSVGEGTMKRSWIGSGEQDVGGDPREQEDREDKDKKRRGGQELALNKKTWDQVLAPV